MKIKLNKSQSETLGLKENQEIEVIQEQDSIDVRKIIKDIVDTDLSVSNEQQGKFSQMIKGLAFSDDPLSNKFMKEVDKMITKLGNDFLEKNK